jgi:hypothetical protein
MALELGRAFQGNNMHWKYSRRKVFESARDEHSSELRNLYSAPNDVKKLHKKGWGTRGKNEKKN